ncbi:CDP-diacylglycerol--glycerol-3-phosphate 3-phosphatidyltransferase [Permianibacter aggregans]|uniref:CDP-diacylglycerol--glycerol-3-phosphate 3-phosphatidyltransferase n=1 Tax=Permianibacter aggregans TaxID=1510150 RepID=A0A4R6UFW2_9GAMM|nr:CDP-diacylglycerol--glycerol-3-phosphate 3-phosphatidyltransferase [Permianibacter aggregans]QGX41612.1 CDP-diacylglycerol--glycerol-3-phosphate 3-phosphatidyltransferase [Permianibacter aggregans]TDQ45681.1 CDP-diacylglycerol--glycerol-3-phosphate 3-phosphatidyltransferase [Permianibacter aggregans]
MTIPNILTLFRIALIPAFVLVFYLPWKWHYLASAAIFALASATDWLDGYIARQMGQTSRLGAFLDPVADKLMVAVALVLLVEVYNSPWLAVAASVIVAREITVSALREWMAELGKRGVVKVSMVGKIKTACQMFAIVVLLATPVGHKWDVFGFVAIYVAVVFTLWSMIVYLKAAWPEFELGAKRH